ncbi:hypothetical protein E2C01_036908 [Portunus trituberculatus]|uniref:Secreted protein n=1 Tax=Portunus trituberculatus TaxID=210409 RepID=A0A5B7FCP2_PORTR|nr:hypothetical protein [Portunus trituberculatus]
MLSGLVVVVVAVFVAGTDAESLLHEVVVVHRSASQKVTFQESHLVWHRVRGCPAVSRVARDGRLIWQCLQKVV